MLRERLTRFLGSRAANAEPGQAPPQITDEEMVRLLEGLDLVSGAREAEARATYAAALPPGSAQPSWDQLVAAGWVRWIWKRYVTHYALYAEARRSPALTALSAWMMDRYDRAPTIIATASQWPPHVQALATRIASGEQKLPHLTCLSPVWVAARLWDRNWRSAPSPEEALRLWVDRWKALGVPRFAPTMVFASEDFTAFHDAAFSVLEAEPDLLNWPDTCNRLRQQTALARGGVAAEYDATFAEPPPILVDRALWIQSGQLERAVLQAMEDAGDLTGLAGLLWEQVSTQKNGRGPDPNAARLLTIAGDRPDLYAALLYRLRAPRLSCSPMSFSIHPRPP